MERTQRARDLLRTMMHATGLSHRRFAQVVGRDQRTINQHANTGTLPESVACWLERVSEIRVERRADGIQATVTLLLPFDRNQKNGHYIREKTRI